MTTVVIQHVQQNDAGLAYTVTINDANGPFDVSRASLVQYLFQKPDGSMLTVNASFVNDGTDGQVVYITGPSDFDQPGTWSHQVYIVIGSSHKYSNTTRFKVYPNLPLEV
jgi:hypothetical protein